MNAKETILVFYSAPGPFVGDAINSMIIEYPGADIIGLSLAGSEVHEGKLTENYRLDSDWFDFAGTLKKLREIKKKHKITRVIIPINNKDEFGYRKPMMLGLVAGGGGNVNMYYDDENNRTVSFETFIKERINTEMVQYAFLPFLFIIGAVAYIWAMWPILLRLPADRLKKHK